MVDFIATRIMEAGDRSVEQGQAKFKAYFPRKTAKYENVRPDVEQILRIFDHEFCIVEVV